MWQVLLSLQLIEALISNLFCFPPATQLFRLLDKYRPETKQDKKARLKARAEARAAGKEDTPTKRALAIRHGVNTVTTLVEKKKAQLVVIANDVDPIEVCRALFSHTVAVVSSYDGQLNSSNVRFCWLLRLATSNFCLVMAIEFYLLNAGEELA